MQALLAEAAGLPPPATKARAQGAPRKRRAGASKATIVPPVHLVPPLYLDIPLSPLPPTLWSSPAAAAGIPHMLEDFEALLSPSTCDVLGLGFSPLPAVRQVAVALHRCGSDHLTPVQAHKSTLPLSLGDVFSTGPLPMMQTPSGPTGRDHRVGTVLSMRDCVPSMRDSLVEVYWEQPVEGSGPPTGWYTAVVQEMAHVLKKQGTTRLFYEQTQSVELLDVEQMTVSLNLLGLINAPCLTCRCICIPPLAAHVTHGLHCHARATPRQGPSAQQGIQERHWHCGPHAPRQRNYGLTATRDACQCIGYSKKNCITRM
jgi:hypothetical protein